MSEPTRPEGTDEPPQYGPPMTLSGNLEAGAEGIADTLHSVNSSSGGVQTKMRASELLSLSLALATLFMAFVVPSAFSLAIKLGAIDPANKDAMLALAIGIAATIVLFTTPISGVLSDRTRSRFGRRRPWFFTGLILGTVGTTLVGFASTSSLIVVGWAIALIGYAVASNSITIYLSDRLPESQRGKVMGLTGSVTQVGPIAGIILAGAFTSQLGLMFYIPAALALLGGLWFGFSMKDPKFTGEVPLFKLRSLTRGFYFNPRKHTNFGWVIVSRLFIFASLAFTALYGVYLLTSRLGMDAAAVAGLFATVSLAGVVLAIVGALGSGLLSDKLRSRKPFLIISGGLLTLSAMLVGTTTTVPQFVVGSLIASLGIGIYGAVDQALALDTLPSEENENGRYLAVFGLGSSVPQALGPFLAGAVLALAGGDYTWVYFAAAAFAALGALSIIPISVGRRARLSTTSISTVR